VVKNILDHKLVAMAMYVLTFVFIYIFCVTFIRIPETGTKYADMALPFLLGSGVGAIVGFYFGSSEGSAQSKEIANKAMEVASEKKS
jgi:hypothetical protein